MKKIKYFIVGKIINEFGGKYLPDVDFWILFN